MGGVSVNIGFEQLKELIWQLSSKELDELMKEMDVILNERGKPSNKSLKHLILHGPILGENEIRKIESARDRINTWRN